MGNVTTGVILNSDFSYTTTFDAITIGEKFIEVLTTCNEVAIRITPTMHQKKPMNAQRIGGKLIFMADWEPVFIIVRKHEKT